MTDLKMECPGCNSWTSAIGLAVANGDPCPYCRLPADAILAVRSARDRRADEALIARALDAEKRAANAERRAAVAEAVLDEIRAALGDDA